MNPPDQWRRLVNSALAAATPRLASLPLEPLGAGLDFWAFALGDDLVVRCPQHGEGARNLAVEQRVLPLVATLIPPGLAIPLPVASAPNPLGPGELGIATRVPGVVISDEQWIGRGLLGDQELAASIAALIDAIAMVPVAEAAALGVPHVERRGRYRAMSSRIVSDVSPRLGDVSVARRLQQVWASFVADGANFSTERSVIHADISLDHLLLDENDAGRVTLAGLIDFGDIAIDDPDYELSYLWAEGGRDFVRRIQACRGRPLSDRLVGKLAFYELADAVTDVLWGLDYADDDLVAESLALIHDVVTSRPVGEDQT